MKRDRGLTLIETLIVVGIIGVLMGILGVVFGPGIAKSRTKPGCASNLRQIAAAYNLYLADNDNGWPMMGGMVSNQIVWSLYKPPRSCPLNGKWHYADGYTNGRWALLHPSSKDRKAFLDGTPVPKFDPSLDVLARCLDHGTDGFSRGAGTVWAIDGKTKGRVLGARLDGSVRYVSPLSCWEARTMPDGVLIMEASLWRGCDSPTKQ